MHNSLFSLDSTMPWFSWVSCLGKTEHCWRQPRKDTQEKLDGDVFQFYKRRLCRFKRSLSPHNLPFSSFCQWSFSLRFALPWEFAFIAESCIKSLFTGIDSSSDTAVSSTQLTYSFMSFFICLFILLLLLINRSLGTFFHGFRIQFPFPDSMF